MAGSHHRNEDRKLAGHELPARESKRQGVAMPAYLNPPSVRV